MKHLTLLTLSIISLNAFAGGDSGPPTSCGPEIDRVLRESSVLDRGGNKVPYKITMLARRCERSGKTFTLKYMYINYNTPILRQENDGRMIGVVTVWSGKKLLLIDHPQAHLHSSTVTEEGIKIQIAGASFPDEDLQLVPEAFTGDNATVIEMLGNAFPTHTIVGPFDR